MIKIGLLHIDHGRRIKGDLSSPTLKSMVTFSRFLCDEKDLPLSSQVLVTASCRPD
jgi:hypothetical protein